MKRCKASSARRGVKRGRGQEALEPEDVAVRVRYVSSGRAYALSSQEVHRSGVLRDAQGAEGALPLDFAEAAIEAWIRHSLADCKTMSEDALMDTLRVCDPRTAMHLMHHGTVATASRYLAEMGSSSQLQDFVHFQAGKMPALCISCTLWQTGTVFVQLAHLLQSDTGLWAAALCATLVGARAPAARGPATRTRARSTSTPARDTRTCARSTSAPAHDSERAWRLLEQQAPDLQLAVLRSHPLVQSSRLAAELQYFDPVLDVTPRAMHVALARAAIEATSGLCAIDGTVRAARVRAFAALLPQIPELRCVAIFVLDCLPTTTVGVLAAAAAQAPNLSFLNYRHGKPAGALTVAREAASCTRLRSLVIADSQLEGKDIDVITPHIAAMSQLTRLSLSNNYGSRALWCPDAAGNVPGVHSLARCLRSLPRLERLGVRELCHEDAVAAVLGPAFAALSRLTHLDISQSPYTNRHGSVVCAERGVLLRQIAGLPALARVELSGSAFNAAALEALEAALHTWPSLARLHLGNVRFEDDTLVPVERSEAALRPSFARCVAAMTQLTRLSLASALARADYAHPPPGGHSDVGVFDAAAAALGALTRLRHLSLSKLCLCPEGASPVSRSSSLRKLAACAILKMSIYRA
jgi:hypothetical protein